MQLRALLLRDHQPDPRRAQGHIGGTILDTSLGAGIDLIDIGLAHAMSFTFQNCYCEANGGSAGSCTEPIGDVGLVFKDCNFRFLMEGATGAGLRQARRAGRLGLQSSRPGRGLGRRDQVRRRPPLRRQRGGDHGGGEIDGTKLLAAARTGAVANPYERHFHNALAGGWALHQLNGQDDYAHMIPFELVDLDTGSRPEPSRSTTEEGYGYSSRNYGTPAYVRTMRAKDDPMFEMVPRGYSAQIVRPKTVLHATIPGPGQGADVRI